jgi:glutamate synthase domain-containing protein 3
LRGRFVLENWDELLPRFVKVFPHEFKKALGLPLLRRNVEDRLPAQPFTTRPPEMREAVHG